jgi:integrase
LLLRNLPATREVVNVRWIGGGVDTRYLEQRRQGWYLVRDVPAKLVALVGRKRLRVSLKTRDLRVAQHRRWEALAKLEGRLNTAAAGADHGALIAEALEIRRQIADPTPVGFEEGPDGEHSPWTARDFAEDIVEAFLTTARRKGVASTALLADVAMGRATPIEPLLEPWLAEQDIEARSKDDHRRAVGELLLWATAQSLAPALEAFDRKAAGRYVTALLERHADRGTVSKRLWSLSALWRWLIRKGHAAENPWRGHGVAQGGRSARDKARERAFTDAELVALLSGPADRALLDLMRCAALSGMRIEELALLEARDVDPAAATMTVRGDPKTAAARRTVPIHSALLPLMQDRCVDKAPDCFVFHELGDRPKQGRERSMAISKRFGRYRVRAGVDARREGQRRGLVNFHSFRRWFITMAERGGQPEHIIRAVVGHKRAGVTLGVYSAGPSLEQRRTCVEAVQLPEECDRGWGEMPT